MTVTELRQALEAIEAAGKGSMQVVYEDCICNDSDYDLEQRDIDQYLIDIFELKDTMQ